MAKKVKRGNPGFGKKLYNVSEDLQAIIKVEEVSRPQAIKKIWEYIKKHGCQDGRTINPDEKMAKVFGKKPFIMFKIAKALGNHLEEK